MNSSDSGPETVSVKTAAEMLGYSRTTIYDRIRAGDLESVVDHRNRRRVLLKSVQAYAADPPSGSWRRPRGAPSEQFTPDIGLRAENLRLREVVSRLQLAREHEAAARAAELEANQLMAQALGKQAEASALLAAAGAELDELLVQFLTPDHVAQVGNSD